MKHFNLLAIGILSLLLVGCSYNANEATSAVSSQMASDDIVTPSTAEHKLSLCVPSSEQGMYTVDSIANGYGNIFYIDFETMQQIPLCGTPNCTHSNDSCTAWLQIDESGFLPGILQLGNSILLVQNGESSNHPACIWIADANGENKKLLFSAQSGQSIGPAFYVRGIRIVGRDNGKKDLKQIRCKNSGNRSVDRYNRLWPLFGLRGLFYSLSGKRKRTALLLPLSRI